VLSPFDKYTALGYHLIAYRIRSKKARRMNAAKQSFSAELIEKWTAWVYAEFIRGIDQDIDYHFGSHDVDDCVDRADFTVRTALAELVPEPDQTIIQTKVAAMRLARANQVDSQIHQSETLFEQQFGEDHRVRFAEVLYRGGAPFEFFLTLGANSLNMLLR
jgi:hypothetical protein